MKMIPVGVQLYSVREDCARDLPGVLAEVAKMGYTGVEFAGYHNFDAKSLRSLLDANGLQCCGAHIGLDQLLEDTLPRTIDFHHTLGNRYLVVPSLPPERRSSRQAWLETARLFAQIAEKLTPHGMLTGFHNHYIEFEALDGETGFDIFFSNTPQEVIMQLDIGHVLRAGADPLVYLNRYPGRAVTIHLKEYSAANPKALLGEGDIPWKQVLELCESTARTEWYIVEQESYAMPPLECIARCRQALAAMGR